MGDKKPSVRTLDDGTKVTHYPDGRQVMVPTNKLAETLEGVEDTHEWLSAEKTQERLAAAQAKRDAQRSGDPIPTDKSPV